MKRINTLRARTEKYKDRQTGQEKQGYQTIGYVLAKEDGTKMLKIDSIPVNFDGWLFIGDLESKGAQQAAQPARGMGEAQQPQTFDDLGEDSIPF